MKTIVLLYRNKNTGNYFTMDFNDSTKALQAAVREKELNPFNVLIGHDVYTH